ncbi:unnamed protein product [Durusdinium trenchii]|uniref:Uncharacterized protein n=1 Tax=Durusdinium trenchii TaxID=1381693 RepID=A0ABP0LQP1_9DINO
MSERDAEELLWSLGVGAALPQWLKDASAHRPCRPFRGQEAVPAIPVDEDRTQALACHADLLDPEAPGQEKERGGGVGVFETSIKGWLESLDDDGFLAGVTGPGLRMVKLTGSSLKMLESRSLAINGSSRNGSESIRPRKHTSGAPSDHLRKR